MKEKSSLFDTRFVWPFILVTTLFLFWGIPNNLNDVLIRQFMKSFEIDRLKAGLVQSAFYLGYFFLSLPAAMFMRKYSYKTGLILGMLLYCAGTFLFYPSAIMGKYIFFLGALFVIASGLTFLELGANAFIVELGDAKTAERRLNFSQAFNPIGAVLGVLIGTLFIFSGNEPNAATIETMKSTGEYHQFLRAETMRVVTPYLVLGIVVFIWSILLWKTKFPEIEREQAETPGGSFAELFRIKNFRNAVLSQFLYVGAQVGIWSFFIQYIQDYTGQSEKLAGFLLTGTLIAFGVGRFFATWMMRYIKPAQLMATFAFINLILVLAGILFPGWIGVVCIFSTSFFMSLMYPTNFALGVKKLGSLTKNGGAILVMTIIGGAIFPPVMGLVAEASNMAIAMIIPLLSFLYVLWFALSCRSD